ncbi:MAG: PGF-pre-PGF domain-containing protein [Methanomicrobia archaeon]|nr:PGF-pre-PGF domain-containing protein [Methanomicrobia archaeon]
MKKITARRKGFVRSSLVLLALAAAILAGTVAAVQGAEVLGVTRYAPAGPAPNAEFDVRLTINGEVPLIVGVVESIPEGFRFVSTAGEHYKVSGQDVAFSVINTREITYRVKAPSTGEGTFTGTWVDLLSEHEGSIADTFVIIGGGGGSSGIAEGTGVTGTTTPTSAAPTVVTKASRTIPLLNAGEEIAMVFGDVDVSLITLEADSTLSDVTVEVERVDRSAGVPEPSGVAYAYLNIEVNHEETANIEGRIECKVEKSWISDKAIDETSFRFYRYEDTGGWQALPTAKSREDADFVYFEAETPGFSLFVLTAEKKPATPTATPISTSLVMLNPIADIAVGEPLIVTGTSDREDAFTITVTAKGPVELAPQTVQVENGKFTATFDTTSAAGGIYTVTADDGEGHRDEATATIGAASAPTPASAVPGFGALFTAVSLLTAGLFTVKLKKRVKGGTGE